MGFLNDILDCSDPCNEKCPVDFNVMKCQDLQSIDPMDTVSVNDWLTNYIDGFPVSWSQNVRLKKILSIVCCFASGDPVVFESTLADLVFDTSWIDVPSATDYLHNYVAPSYSFVNNIIITNGFITIANIDL